MLIHSIRPFKPIIVRMITELALTVILLGCLQCYLGEIKGDAERFSSAKALVTIVLTSSAIYVIGKRCTRKLIAYLSFTFFALSLGLYLIGSYDLLKLAFAILITNLFFDMVTYRWKVMTDTYWSVYAIFGIIWRSMEFINKGAERPSIREFEKPLIVGDITAFCTVIFAVGVHALLPYVPACLSTYRETRKKWDAKYVPNLQWNKFTSYIIELTIFAVLALILYFFIFSVAFSQLYATNPVDWLLATLLARSDSKAYPEMLGLSIFWLGVIAISALLAGRVVDVPSKVPAIDREKKEKNLQVSLPQILCRKIFHFATAFIFIPGLYISMSSSFVLLAVSSSIAIGLLFIVEVCRNSSVTAEYLFEHVFVYYKKFIDHRDIHHNIILSHIYLLLGCAIPIWYYLHFKVRFSESFSTNTPIGRLIELVRYFGIVSVCIGDSVGALVGVYFGKNKWKSTILGPFIGAANSSAGNRSVEGSFGVFFSTLVAFLIIFVATFSANEMQLWDFASLLVLSIVVSLTEAFSSSNDNVMMPFAMILTALTLILTFSNPMLSGNVSNFDRS